MIQQITIDLRDATEFETVPGALLDEQGRAGKEMDIFYRMRDGQLCCLELILTEAQHDHLRRRVQSWTANVNTLRPRIEQIIPASGWFAYYRPDSDDVPNLRPLACWALMRGSEVHGMIAPSDVLFASEAPGFQYYVYMNDTERWKHCTKAIEEYRLEALRRKRSEEANP